MTSKSKKKKRWVDMVKTGGQGSPAIHQVLMMSIDAVIILVSFVLAVAVGGHEIAEYNYRWYEYLWMFAVLVAIKVFVFERIGFYKEIIRYVSMDFAVRIVKATVFSSLVCIGIIHMVRPELGMQVLVVDWMASCILIGMSRFGMRYVQEGWLGAPTGRRTLLYGAGEHGAMVARFLKKDPSMECRVVGFIDDDSSKLGKKVHGTMVLGTCEELPQLVRAHHIEEVIVSIANPDGDIVKELYRTSKRLGVRCRIVPGIADVFSGKEVVRNIDIADLMRRPKRTLDREGISRFLRDMRVMITGAAGSIGSELVKQVLEYSPSSVLVADNSEYGLYRLDEALRGQTPGVEYVSALVDVKDESHVRRVVENYRPDVIFHAAAYKHVHILEECEPQAVLNNVGGTINIARAADAYGVRHFVYISTDKAVKPTSVMGATKRVGELFVQNFNQRSRTKFVSVRFGNVLASSGSVVPKFIEQIKSGGPVTVTHPDVTRYFMLIPEAVELVLQAASIGNGGEIFILDMGRPIKIAEMAEDLISLMGYVPNRDVHIHFTGMRKGEKLHEELFFEDFEKPTVFKDIRVGRACMVDWELLESDIHRLMDVARSHDSDAVLGQLKRLVPEHCFAKGPRGLKRYDSAANESVAAPKPQKTFTQVIRLSSSN